MTDFSAFMADTSVYWLMFLLYTCVALLCVYIYVYIQFTYSINCGCIHVYRAHASKKQAFMLACVAWHTLISDIAHPWIICLSMSINVYLFTDRSIYLSIYMLYLSISLSLPLSLSLSLSLYLSLSLSRSLSSIYLKVHLRISIITYARCTLSAN